MTPSPPTQPFLDPQRLIAGSRVLGRSNGRFFFFSIVLLLPLTLFLGNQQSPLGQVLRLILPLLLAALMLLWTFVARTQAQSLKREGQAVDALEELIQLRRWPEAAEHAQRVLGDAMLVPERRMQALMCLATILQRYHRFEDARLVHDYLLSPDDGAPVPDGSTSHTIRVARAMALLRDDRLVDADRAISDLRRDVNKARDQLRRLRQDMDPEGTGRVEESGAHVRGAIESAGLLLVELYRDVKTGHSREAIEMFEAKQRALRDHLGHRVGDAWALAAQAYDATGQPDRAADAYSRATTLVPAVELHRRYPETAGLETRYTATAVPSL